MISWIFTVISVTYDWSDVDELTLAYVVSVHKAQGSEFPVIVMPIVTQHYTMLQRNLLYTAITCAVRNSRAYWQAVAGPSVWRGAKHKLHIAL